MYSLAFASKVVRAPPRGWRLYSDFLRDLPRTGVSRFGKKKAPTPPAGAGAGAAAGAATGAATGAAKPKLPKSPRPRPPPPASAIGSQGNRFAEAYRRPPPSLLVSRDKRPHRDGMTEHDRAKEALRQAQAKAAPRPPSGAKPRHNEHRARAAPPKRAPIAIQIPSFVSVSNLATIMGVYLSDLLSKMALLGFEGMRHNFILDKETAALVADEYGFAVTVNDELGADLFAALPAEDGKVYPLRAPIVTIMGHVDHGKTTILDYLRKSSVVSGEHGGITQHIGAFLVVTPQLHKRITFLDTPGHAAFLKMRERGAQVTDIVVLVVAADDSVMPQTVEAIKHAQKAGVPMIVAVNKCDKPTANPDKAVADVAAHGVEVEEYGGDTQTVRILGKTGLNMDKLEEAIITLSEMLELQAPLAGPAEGWVVESEMKRGLGNVATVLVKRGTMKAGQVVVAGTTYCKIRGMRDELGKPIKLAGPLTPVEVWGWKELPGAGDEVLELKTEQFAKRVCENRVARQKQIQAARDIDTINQKRQGEVKELERQERLNEMKLAGLSELDMKEEATSGGPKLMNFIVKADVYGSAEAIKESIDGLGNDEVKAVVVFEEAGQPTEGDLDRAEAAGAQILCFNLKVSKDIQAKASKQKVEIKEHNVIYHLIEDVTKVLTDQLAPRIETKVLAEVEVRDVFTITGKNKSKFKIAGSKVTTGLVKRASLVLVERGGVEVYRGKLLSLKHVKDDVLEVKKGTECGIAFEGWEDFQPGDVVKVFEQVVHPRYL